MTQTMESVLIYRIHCRLWRLRTLRALLRRHGGRLLGSLLLYVLVIGAAFYSWRTFPKQTQNAELERPAAIITFQHLQWLPKWAQMRLQQVGCISAPALANTYNRRMSPTISIPDYEGDCNRKWPCPSSRAVVLEWWTRAPAISYLEDASVVLNAATHC